jgi:hypothetical protein
LQIADESRVERSDTANTDNRLHVENKQKNKNRNFIRYK